MYSLEPRDRFLWGIAHQAQSAGVLKNAFVFELQFSAVPKENLSIVPFLLLPGISLHNWSLYRLFCGVAIAWWHYIEGLQRFLRGNGGYGHQCSCPSKWTKSINFSDSLVCCCGSSWVLHKLPKTQDLFLSHVVEAFPILAVLFGHLL